MSYPGDLKYTNEHEWVRVDDGTATVGITVVTAVASNAENATSANMPIVVAAYVGESRRGRGSTGAVKVTRGRYDLKSG